MSVASLASAAASVLLATTLAGCAMSPRTNLVEVSAGQYELTKRSGFLATPKPEELKYQAEQEALQYCEPRGGKVSILDSRAIEAKGTDYASASVLFRCG